MFFSKHNRMGIGLKTKAEKFQITRQKIFEK
jgi:hypothetical protein